MNVLITVLELLLFPGLLFVSAAGLLVAGFDRKVLARMQRRIGPPIMQPFYDFFKLIGKETIVPHSANRYVFIGAPIVGFISLVVMMLFIPICGWSALSGSGDLIIILYLLTIPAVALIVAGACSGSPYAGVGISREMVTMISYELPLILVFLAVAKLVGGDTLTFAFKDISAWQAGNGPIIAHISMIPAALAMLLIIPAEVGSQPFDVAEAETEICEGPLVEYSGTPLAFFKLNTSLKMFIMTALFTSLFLGGFSCENWFGGAVPKVICLLINGLIVVIISILLTLICMTLIHASAARFKIEHLFKFYWTIVSGLALISLILVWIGL